MNLHEFDTVCRVNFKLAWENYRDAWGKAMEKKQDGEKLILEDPFLSHSIGDEVSPEEYARAHRMASTFWDMEKLKDVHTLAEYVLLRFEHRRSPDDAEIAKRLAMAWHRVLYVLGIKRRIPLATTLDHHRITLEERLAVRQAVNLVDLVDKVTPLKRSGRENRGLCPFHDEKTPSFYVNEDDQVFYCQGCHVGGDVFTFVMLSDKCSFVEAFRQLAEKAGLMK